MTPLTFRMFCAAVVFLAIGAGASAQAPGPAGRGGEPPFGGGRLGGFPRRDNIPPPTGTAKITGRVISAETATPIRRAQIRISSNDARTNRDVATDSDGRFEFLRLPAGRYRLHVTKAGYVSLEYGQDRPFEAGNPLDLADGQVLERIDFSLPRGSAISGRITDEFGDPITDVQVQAMRYQFENGARQLVNAGRVAMTDDLGQFRIFGLMPGDYVVRASLRTNPNAAATGPGAAESPMGYPGTYYPGVTDLAQAQTITVSLGQELGSVAFSLVPARLARISGTVTSSDGRPLVGAIVALRTPGSSGALARFNLTGTSQVRADGVFTLTNVPPGEYVLDVQQRPQNLQSLQNLNLAQLEFASMPLSVSGDMDGLSIVTTPGVTLSGRVVFEGSNAQKASARGIQVSAAGQSGPPPLMAMARMLGGGRVNDDGTFELRGLAGSQIIRATGLPVGWAVKSISLDGADVTDAAFDFRSGASFTGVIITLTDRVTEISGGVLDARGQPLTDYVLVVFPEDTKLWGAQSRYVTTTRPNQNGAFTITGLPPARYLAAVVASLETGMQDDVAVLTQLRPRAESFSLAEGQRLNLQLKVPPQ